MISYPWSDFLSEIDEFYLFGYGSLINEYSYSKDIKSSSELIPVIGYEIKRILNYSPDEIVRSRPLYHDPNRGDRYSAAFNIIHTKKISDKVNGVLRKIKRKDFESLITRERGYSLIKVKCESFGSITREKYEAYALSAPVYYNDRKLIDNKLLPNVPYYKICKKGASDISEDFLKLWLETSYLGDGRNVVDWEKDEGGI